MRSPLRRPLVLARSLTRREEAGRKPSPEIDRPQRSEAPASCATASWAGSSSMMASLRAKTGGVKRSGNGRECKLLPRQNSLVQDNNSENRTKVPARAGHGAQAAAWNSSLNFVKSPKATNSSSNSTSPETDPGTSDLFPFFKGNVIPAVGQNAPSRQHRQLDEYDSTAVVFSLTTGTSTTK